MRYSLRAETLVFCDIFCASIGVSGGVSFLCKQSRLGIVARMYVCNTRVCYIMASCADC